MGLLLYRNHVSLSASDITVHGVVPRPIFGMKKENPPGVLTDHEFLYVHTSHTNFFQTSSASSSKWYASVLSKHLDRFLYCLRYEWTEEQVLIVFCGILKNNQACF